jgi:crotonobetainyl-CoA:carnitine CoA-transferase CaiB-like acyl-CoA transferase
MNAAPEETAGPAVAAPQGGAGPLAGVTVLDLTNTMLGPYCTLILSQLGADVIKVEPPQGDVTRHISARRSPLMPGTFLNLNQGKRSIVLDLKNADDHDTLMSLVNRADVFIHNLRAAAATRIGIDHDTIAAHNPAIVYCAAEGFGCDGPYAGQPAYDDIVQAMSGFAALQGGAAGPPTYVRSVVADKITGLTAVYAITAALFERERTGRGQGIRVPMFETLASFLLIEHMHGMTFEPPVGPAVYPRLMSKYRKPYKTRDGYLAAIPYTDQQWARFLGLIERPELKDAEPFASFQSRSENPDIVYEFLERALAEKTTAEWLDLLTQADIPAAPVNSIEDLLEDRHLRSVGLIRDVDHPTEGRIRAVVNPVSFSRSPHPRVGVAPGLGEHSEQIRRAIDADRGAELSSPDASPTPPGSDPHAADHKQMG